MFQQAFTKAIIWVRLDPSFAGPRMFDVLDRLDVHYIIAIDTNNVVQRKADAIVAKARDDLDCGNPLQHYTIFMFRTSTWTIPRRVVCNAEVVQHRGQQPRVNTRFVVTNVMDEPAAIYDLYRQRGDIENCIKELKVDIELDRTSSHRFLTNQFHVLEAAMDYMLFQEMRWREARIELSRTRVFKLREMLLKVSA